MTLEPKPGPRSGAGREILAPRPRIARQHAVHHVRQRRWDRGCPIRCLLTTVHHERSLSRALVQHLCHEMPDIEFTLNEELPLDAVWVCGYEPGAAELVRRLRQRHPAARLLVTARGRLEAWADEVRRAGADDVCSWPVPYRQLSRVLHSVVSRP